MIYPQAAHCGSSYLNTRALISNRWLGMWQTIFAAAAIWCTHSSYWTNTPIHLMRKELAYTATPVWMLYFIPTNPGLKETRLVVKLHVSKYSVYKWRYKLFLWPLHLDFGRGPQPMRRRLPKSTSLNLGGPILTLSSSKLSAGIAHVISALLRNT